MSDFAWFWITLCAFGIVCVVGATVDDIYTHQPTKQECPVASSTEPYKMPPYTENGHITCIYQEGISSLEADGHSYTPPRKVLQCDNGYDYPTDLGSKI